MIGYDKIGEDSKIFLRELKEFWYLFVYLNFIFLYSKLLRGVVSLE